MSVNSFSSNYSHVFSGMYCLLTRPSSFIYIAFNITNILLLLPLCVFILYLGLQRWRQQRSTSTAAMASHSDSFTYHLVAMELIGVLGYILCCCGIYSNHSVILLVGYCLCSSTWYGEMFFHILTCVERYLAVVHPITYLSLRGERGIRIRNISIGCVWLLCFVAACRITFEGALIIMDSCLLIFSFIVIFFCSLSVLCVLIRPGPGEQGGDRKSVDQSKQRAFYTIVAILGVLMLKCVWNLTWVVLNVSKKSSDCVVMMSGVWLNLPSSLVLPLLFLHRAGTLVCCKNKSIK